jgi:predicted Zn-dependent peptidase
VPLRDRIADHTLPNGLRVVAVEDRAAPVTAVNVWYDVGSRHEPSDRTGFAHLFEHLMFQGSRNVAATEHFSYVQGVGGTLNGTTSFDRTNYFETVPSHALELALWLEADRMGTLLDALDQANLDNQRDVVKNERRQRYDNVPYGTVWERLFALAFPAGHPYHHLPIGSMEHLDAASLDDVRSFFTTWYAPDNATLTIVGDRPTGEAIEAAERAFGWVPRGGGRPEPAPGTVGPLEAEQRVTVDDEDVPAESVYTVYRIPADGSPECDAVEVALAVLGEGSSSWMASRLVRRDQLAQSVQTGAQRLVGGASLGLVIGRARSGVELSALETAIDAEIARLAADGPDPESLERAKALLERHYLDSVSTAEGLADELNRHATLFGDPGGVDDVLPHWAVVTAEQVQQATQALLTPTNRAVVAYRQPAGEAA